MAGTWNIEEWSLTFKRGFVRLVFILSNLEAVTDIIGLLLSFFYSQTSQTTVYLKFVYVWRTWQLPNEDENMNDDNWRRMRQSRWIYASDQLKHEREREREEKRRVCVWLGMMWMMWTRISSKEIGVGGAVRQAGNNRLNPSAIANTISKTKKRYSNKQSKIIIIIDAVHVEWGWETVVARVRIDGT